MHCRKCNAGKTALVPLTEYLENGSVLQTVLCVICGDRRSREAPGRMVRRLRFA